MTLMSKWGQKVFAGFAVVMGITAGVSFAEPGFHGGGHFPPPMPGGMCAQRVSGSVSQLDQAARNLTQALRFARGNAYVLDAAFRFENAVSNLREGVFRNQDCRDLRGSLDQARRELMALDSQINSDQCGRNMQVIQQLNQIRLLVQQVEQGLTFLPPPPPPPRTMTTQVELGSSRYRFNSTMLPGLIQNVILVQQHSFSACVQGRSFGINGQQLWVDQGCNGTFQVTYFTR